MSKKRKFQPEVSPEVERMAEMVRREAAKRLAPNATYEERREMAARVMSEVLWTDEERDLRESVTDAEEIEVDGIRYRRLSQPSSARYYGRWGPHDIEESLYRQIGVRNGPTIKPLELRVGMIAKHMTPDFARIVGELGAHATSRELEGILRAVGMVPPERAFLERRCKQMACEVAEEIERLEAHTRERMEAPTEVASISAGLDRFAVRMAELANDESATTSRTEPYQRTPPPPKEYHFRKAWVGSLTIYDKDGKELHTWRYATDADSDAEALAKRVTADIEWLREANPGITVRCIQDAAPELRVLPEVLEDKGIPVDRLIDFEHLAGYLDAVVDACESEGDPSNMKGWYRGELLRDDDAIDRIHGSLQARALGLEVGSRAQAAVGDALSYIANRKDMMRYATAYAANLPIGSGATESTCWTMQRRVKRAGQSWEPPGLRGVLALRSLVLSDRWPVAWAGYAAKNRAEVTCVC